MRVNRVERREHERRSGQDRRKMPDRKNLKMETIDRRKEEKRKEIRREEEAEKRFDDQIEGRNSVLELLESGKDVNKIFVTRGEKHGSINKILGIAKERKIIVVEKDKKQMDEMAQEENYQGVIAIVPPFEYVEISDILEVAKERNQRRNKEGTAGYFRFACYVVQLLYRGQKRRIGILASHFFLRIRLLLKVYCTVFFALLFRVQ